MSEADQEERAKALLAALLAPVFEMMKRAGIKRMSFELDGAVVQLAKGGVFTIPS